MSNKTTKTLPSLMSCFMVTFTDSVNSNMGFLHERATAEAPATAVRRTLVDGYEVFSRFSSGNGLPLLATKPRGCEPREEPAPYPGQGVSLQRASLLTPNGVGFQFFCHDELLA